MCVTLIDVAEFHQIILKLIGSDELNKMIDSSLYADDKEARAAINYGMILAALFTSKCAQYGIKADNNEEEI